MPPDNSQSPSNPPNPEYNPLLRQIRTFQGDVAEALGRQKESLVSIQRSQSLQNRLDPTDLAAIVDSRRRKKNFFFFLGTLVLLAAGGLGGLYTYGEYVKKIEAPTIAIPTNRFVTPTKEVELNVSGLARESFIINFNTALQGTVHNELRQLILQRGTTSQLSLLKTEEFLNIINSHAPGPLVRSMSPDFMAGSVGGNTFLIFKLTSFDNAFPGMLNWEKDIPRDIGYMFAIAPMVKNIAPSSVFTDVTIKNKDVRQIELSEASSTAVLLYSFFDSDTLIITDSIDALQTLIDRLTREKLTR